jgi:hypothetical protein
MSTPVSLDFFAVDAIRGPQDGVSMATVPPSNICRKGERGIRPRPTGQVLGAIARLSQGSRGFSCLMSRLCQVNRQVFCTLMVDGDMIDGVRLGLAAKRVGLMTQELFCWPPATSNLLSHPWHRGSLASCQHPTSYKTKTFNFQRKRGPQSTNLGRGRVLGEPTPADDGGAEASFLFFSGWLVAAESGAFNPQNSKQLASMQLPDRCPSIVHILVQTLNLLRPWAVVHALFHCKVS